MRYISLDIETTGLDPDQDQVLQIAMVKDDLSNPQPLENLECLNLFIKHERLSGHPYALALNHKILQHPNAVSPSRAFTKVQNFLNTDDQPTKGWVFAGKNVMQLDIPFLLKGKYILKDAYHYRAIDPSILFLKPEDEVVPGLSQCLNRAGFSDVVSHDALDDALQIVQLVRHSLGHIYKGSLNEA